MTEWNHHDKFWKPMKHYFQLKRKIFKLISKVEILEVRKLKRRLKINFTKINPKVNFKKVNCNNQNSLEKINWSDFEKLTSDRL
jgi:hypothetical protein